MICGRVCKTRLLKLNVKNRSMNWGQKLVSKNIRSGKILGEQKNFESENFGSTKFFGQQNFLISRICWSSEIFGEQKLLIYKNFWWTINFGWQKFLINQIFGQQKFLSANFFCHLKIFCHQNLSSWYIIKLQTKFQLPTTFFEVQSQLLPRL